jgi:hypothetical protein
MPLRFAAIEALRREQIGLEPGQQVRQRGAIWSLSMRIVAETVRGEHAFLDTRVGMDAQ